MVPFFIMMDEASDSDSTLSGGDDGLAGSSPSVISAEPQMEEGDNCCRQLPTSPEVIRRLKALFKLQGEIGGLCREMLKEVCALEAKYLIKAQGLLAKRRGIVVGEHEPTDWECDLSGIDAESSALEKSLSMLAISKRAGREEEERMATREVEGASGGSSEVTKEAVPKGVPNFWLEAFKGSSEICGAMEDHDMPVLAYLTDLYMTAPNPETSYVLHFEFAENPYFTDRELTKLFEFVFPKPLELSFLPKVVKGIGCTIHWKEGKDVTQKEQRVFCRSENGFRMSKAKVNTASFFNFFGTKDCSAEPNSSNNEMVEELVDDFRLGEFLKSRIIPYAPFYFACPEEVEEADFDEYEVDPSCSSRIIVPKAGKHSRDGAPRTPVPE